MWSLIAVELVHNGVINFSSMIDMIFCSGKYYWFRSFDIHCYKCYYLTSIHQTKTEWLCMQSKLYWDYITFVSAIRHGHSLLCILTSSSYCWAWVYNCIWVQYLRLWVCCWAIGGVHTMLFIVGLLLWKFDCIWS